MTVHWSVIIRSVSHFKFVVFVQTSEEIIFIILLLLDMKKMEKKVAYRENNILALGKSKSHLYSLQLGTNKMNPFLWLQ